MAAGADAGRRRQPPARSAGPRATPRSARCCAAPRPTPPAAARPHTAAAYLERALRSALRATTAAACSPSSATVAFDAGLPDSRERLREALREAHDRDSRLDVLTRLAALNVVDADEPGCRQLFEQELAGETDPRRAPGDRGRGARRAAHVPRPPRRSARGAWRRSTVDAIADPLLRADDPRAPRVGRHRARRAATRRPARRWPARRSTATSCSHDAGRRRPTTWRTRALVMTDHADEARAAIAACATTPDQRGSLRLRAAAAWYAADLALRRGRVAEAEDEARAALYLVDDDVSVLTGGAASVLVRALAERGAFDEARELLRERGLDGSLTGWRWESVCSTRARGCRSPRATTSAPRRGARDAARRAPARAPEPHAGPRGARPPRWRSHTSAAAEAAALADADWRWPSASARRCRSPARCTPARVAEPDDAARIALLRARRSRRRRRAGRLGRPRCGSSSAAPPRTWAGASRRARRCAPRWPTPTPSARCCSPSAPAASSSPPGCARVRRRSKAPRR